jgi:hypothetical protein
VLAIFELLLPLVVADDPTAKGCIWILFDGIDLIRSELLSPAEPDGPASAERDLLVSFGAIEPVVPEFLE